jgi:hypothetical protein
MKKIFNTAVVLWIIGLVILLNISCKKDTIKNLPMASLNVVNAVAGGTQVRLGSYSGSIPNNFFRQSVLLAGENDLYLWPVGDSLHPYYTYSKFNVEDRDVYSLFLCGTPVAGVEGIIVKENLPYHSDSTCGIRIINLSPNSGALNITLSISPTVNEVSNLVYKQYTDFKLYPAKASNVSYVFQVRKVSDNTLLSSLTLSTPRFANVTLVIRGMVGSSPALGVIRVNNDR